MNFFAHKIRLPQAYRLIRTAKCSFSSSTQFLKQQLALVMGCNGALGSTITSHLKGRNENIKIVGADVTEKDSDVDIFIPLQGGDAQSISEDLIDGFQRTFTSNPMFDVMICANGGFAMDTDQEADKMDSMNFEPVASVVCDALLKQISRDDALLVAFGSTAALADIDENSPMKKYLRSKKDVHEIIQRIGSSTLKAVKKSKRRDDIELRKRYDCLAKLSAVAILPTTLDTAANRQAMKPSEEELEKWTKLEDVALEICKWVKIKELRPSSGSLISCRTEDGITEFVISR